MPTIVTTPGSPVANSYADVAEANTYHLTRPAAQVLVWDDADTADKEAALITATELLDASLTWTGSVVSTTQSLMWPRNGMVNPNGAVILNTVIPTQLKRATAEFARQLLEGNRVADNDVARQGITDLKAGPVSLSFNKDVAWDDPVPQVIPDLVKLLLPKSWYVWEKVPLCPIKAI